MRFVALTLLFACGGTVAPPKASSLQHKLEQAADLEGVPRSLLIAMAYVDSRVSMRSGAASVDNAYGLLHLVDRADAPAAQSLLRASQLTGLDATALRNDAYANARGGAALLREQADSVFATYPGLNETALGDWYAAVMRMSGSTEPLVADGYAAQVFRILRDGLNATGDGGESVLIVPQAFDIAGRAIYGRLDQSLAGEYCPAGACVAFVPAASTNFAAGRAGSPIDMVVIHDMEGTYSSTIAWFQNPSSQVSAHYDVRSSDGQITQQVLDADTAWHAGNHDVNARAIGVEHEGYAAQGAQWYTAAMYQSSAALVRWLCDTYSIPKDRQHIIGHYEVPDLTHPGWYGGASHHHDPCDVWAGDPTWNNVTSCAWDWNQYMGLIASGGSTSPSTSITAPADGALVSGIVSVTAAATNAARIEIDLDGSVLATGTSAPLTATWDTTRSSAGTHVLVSKAYDTAGNAVTSSQVTVSVSAPAGAPTVSITQPGNGTTVSGTVAATAVGSAGSVRVELYLDGTLLASASAASLTDNWDTTTVADGSHQLQAKAYASNGTGGSSSVVSVTVSNATPTPAPCPAGTIQAGDTCIPPGGCSSAGGSVCWLAAGLLLSLRRRRGLRALPHPFQG